MCSTGTQEYAHANFHMKHRFVYSTTAALPFGRGKKFGNNMSKAADLLVGGWQAEWYSDTFLLGLPSI